MEWSAEFALRMLVLVELGCGERLKEGWGRTLAPYLTWAFGEGHTKLDDLQPLATIREQPLTAS